jgi:hypothetical protein
MKNNLRLLAAVALALPVLAHADPDDYIITPNVEYGEREIDTKYGTERFKDQGLRNSAGSIGFGWGAREWLFLEGYLKYHKEGSEKTRYDAVELESRFQLTEHNQYPVDVGFVAEFEVPREHHEEGYEFKFGPLFQMDTGPVRWNANLLFQRHYHGEEPSQMQMSYQLQSRYDFSGDFGVGVQAFGAMGKWNHWAAHSEQEHVVGPALFGRVKLGSGRRDQIKWNAAYLFKASDAAPDNRFRVQVEYEF